MKIHTWLLLILLALTAAFAALNWGTFMAPTSLSLGVTEVQGPLGLIMLGLLGFITMLFLFFALSLQTSVLFEARRHARDLRTSRELADQAEASQLRALHDYLQAELERQAESAETARTSVLARLDQLDQDLRALVEQTENSLSAHLGELEDRLDREGQPLTLPPEPPA